VRPMRMGLLMAKGAENVLTVKAFVDHCRDLVAKKAVPGMNLTS
jgi:hypothetical protein